jgi:DNA-binding beta-propeller fold protein YncE
MHILPELKKLEKEFPNNLVVIGVHSAKFDTEKGTENIREAILRYEIEHPVINDNNHELWDTYEVNSWPTICLIDPEGMFVGRNSGEFKAPLVSAVIQNALPYYREQGLLDEKPLDLQLEAHKVRPTPLRFPGKILADEKGGRLFITDSNHNRIVVTTLDGRLLEIIGSGGVGRGDGDYQNATFNHPQGCALVGNTLYVADTENHLLRKVELDTKSVTTIAGTGEQGDFTNAFPGWDGSPLRGQRKRWLGAPQATPLNSPWALWVHKKDLFIAMAGYHQIWKMPLDEKEIGPYAGNGREDIVDGPRMPTDPFRGGSSFAQPSGLSSDGKVLFVADSEGSSIRAVPLESLTRPVDTVIGTSHLATSRLFTFGDVDGGKGTARLQHCLEVVFHEGKLYVADTYNHKIKVVDPKTGDTKTFAGTGKPGRSDDPAEFREPAGLAAAKGKLFVADTNNHLIRTIDIATGKVATLAIPGLTPPGASSTDAAGSGAQAPPAGPAAERPDFATAQQVNVPPVRARPTGSAIQLHVKLEPPAGWKINPLAPMSYWLDAATPSGPADRAAFGRVRLPKPTAEFDVPVKVSGTGEETIRVALSYFYCQESDNGVCKIGAVVFNVPVTVADDGTPGPIELSHTILE